MHYLDIHTHYAREAHNIDSRVSYRPTETLSTQGFYSIGLHPCYPEDMTEEAYALLCQRITREPMVWSTNLFLLAISLLISVIVWEAIIRQATIHIFGLKF